MSDLSFTWKGVSSDTHGLVVTKLPPVTIWQVRDEPWPVSGRDGSLHVRDGALEEALWPVTFYLPYEQGATVADIATIKEWLRGEGWFTASNQPGYKFYAYLIEASSLDDWVPGFSDKIATIYFTAQPYSMRASSPAGIELTASSGLITNGGKAICKPTWTIYGSGNFVFTVGTQVCELDDVDGYITVDSALLYVHKDGAPCYPQMTGEFPVLDPGSNTYGIVTDGTFTKIVYDANERDY